MREHIDEIREAFPRFVLRGQLQLAATPTSLDDDVNDVDDEVDEDPSCAFCAGTGEGQYDGQSCSYCKGKGY